MNAEQPASSKHEHTLDQSPIDPFGEVRNLGKRADKLTAEEIKQLLFDITKIPAQQVGDCSDPEEVERRTSICDTRYRELRQLRADCRWTHGSTSDRRNFSDVLPKDYIYILDQAQAAYLEWREQAQAYGTTPVSRSRESKGKKRATKTSPSDRLSVLKTERVVDAFGKLENEGTHPFELTKEQFSKLISDITAIATGQFPAFNNVHEAEHQLSVCTSRLRVLNTLRLNMQSKYGTTKDNISFDDFVPKEFPGFITSARTAYASHQKEARKFIKKEGASYTQKKQEQATPRDSQKKRRADDAAPETPTPKAPRQVEAEKDDDAGASASVARSSADPEAAPEDAGFFQDAIFGMSDSKQAENYSEAERL